MAHYRQCGLVKGPKFRVCKEGLLLILSVFLHDCVYNLIWKWLQRSIFEGRSECKASPGEDPQQTVLQEELGLPLSPESLPFSSELCTHPGAAAAQSTASRRISTRTKTGSRCNRKGFRGRSFVLPRMTSALTVVLWISSKGHYVPFQASLEGEDQNVNILSKSSTLI